MVIYLLCYVNYKSTIKKQEVFKKYSKYVFKVFFTTLESCMYYNRFICLLTLNGLLKLGILLIYYSLISNLDSTGPLTKHTM